MKEIDKAILKLEVEIARNKAEVNGLVDELSKFNLFFGESNQPAISVTKKSRNYYVS